MGKHSSEITTEINLKKVFSIVILISVFIAIIFGIMILCGFNANPQKTIDKAFMALKIGDIEEVNKYTDYNKIIYSLDEILVEEENLEITKDLFIDMNWKIKNIQIDKNVAIAEVEVTNKNFVSIMTNWIKKIIGEKASKKEITNELFIDCLKETLLEVKELKTNSQEIKLIKINRKWNIEVNENLRSLLYPGIDSVVEGLDQIKQNLN